MKISPGLELAWRLAAEEAHALRQDRIHPEHLFLGLCGLERAVLLKHREELPEPARKRVLSEFDALKGALAPAPPMDLAEKLRRLLPKGAAPSNARTISRNAEAKAAFERAAGATGRASALDLLAALLDAPTEAFARVLAAAGLDPAGARERAGRAAGRERAERFLREAARQDRAAAREEEGETPRRGGRGGEGSALERFGRDLTRLAAEGKLAPVIGRRPVLLQIIQTLARASKNNVVLVGEAGVGKTAVVEALAQRAAAGKDPGILAGKRIVELQVGALVAGTKMRGEFEARLQAILDEARADPDLIVFIDELHTVIGAGRAEGGADAANLLKPALARGEFRCIGATTLSEFEKHVEGDAALERRFEKVLVPEPSREEALEILRGLRPRWEAHHRLAIGDDALEAAVDLSIRFDTSRRLPDKAIDLVDRAASRARLPDLSMGPGGKAPAPGGGTLGPEEVAAVVCERTGVPAELVRAQLGSSGGAGRLEGLAPLLRKRLVGQDEAIERVCSRLLTAHSGLSGRRGPLAVFLFLGPSGVGKTELARSLAEGTTGSEAGLIRLDMSEFMEAHSVSKLIGSPPGYVGHEEPGRLTSALRAKPYAVVLLDEVEKAHPRVLDLFLQLFDEGRLTDAKGRTADARNAVFVMTSNLGSSEAGEVKPPIGFGDRKPEPDGGPEAAARGFFRAELLNRVSERIVFRRLEATDAERALARLLLSLEREARERLGAELEVDEDARDLVLREGFSPDYGVRALGRALDRLLRDPLAKLAAKASLQGRRVRASGRESLVRLELVD